MKTKIGSARLWLPVVAGCCFAFVTIVIAQVQTTTNITSEAASHEESIERGEVVLVSGNDLVVKMADGSLRDFRNIPESSKVTVDGRELGIHELQPGMKLERTIRVTTTPQTIITVKTVTGKVWHVAPPTSVTLTLEDGTNQQFTIPRDQKFNINGEELDAFHLKKGMKVTATKVIEEPTVVIEQQQRLTGSMPPPPPAPQADLPILIAKATPPPAPAPASELPTTAGFLPLIGLIGVLCLASSLGLKVFRSIF